MPEKLKEHLGTASLGLMGFGGAVVLSSMLNFVGLDIKVISRLQEALGVSDGIKLILGVVIVGAGFGLSKLAPNEPDSENDEADDEDDED